MKVKKLLLLACALAFSWSTQAAEAEHNHAEADKPRDMGKMWQASLARQPISLSTAFDREGGLWLVRAENGHVLVSRSSDRGKTFGPAVQVNPEPEIIAADGENRPKLAFGLKGEIYVSWTRSLDKPFSGHVRFARSLDGGRRFSPPLTVNDNLEVISHRFEALGVDSKGRIHLAWLDKRDLAAAEKKGQKYQGNGVYYAVSSDNGKTFSANRKLADHSCECCRVAMDFDTDGTPVVFWRHIYGRNVRDHALLRVDGQSDPVRVSHDYWEIAACPHHGGAISISPDGTYHLTWFNNGPERHGLFYVQSGDQGKTFSTPLPIGDFDAQAAHPHVLAADKRVFLVWKEFDGKLSSIRVMRSTDGGRNWNPAETAATTEGGSDHPMLVSDGQHAWLSWNTAREGLRFLALEAGSK